MPWRGSTVVIAGLLDGYVDVASEVNSFSQANVLTRVLFRVADAPDGGDTIIELNSQEDGLGDSIAVTIADGETYGENTGSISVGSLWQIITQDNGTAMTLSGEYELNSVDGVTDPFTTLAKVKLDADIAGTDADRDTVLNSMIAGVTRQMQDWMGREIVQGTATAEKIDGHYSDEIYTKHYPIIEVTTLTENDSALVEDTGFEVLAPDLPYGKLVRISGTTSIAWATGRRNISITYDHGYVNVPSSLVTAATSLVVAKYFETLQSGNGWRGLTSKGVDPNATTTYDKDIWERETIPAMTPFRRRVA